MSGQEMSKQEKAELLDRLRESENNRRRLKNLFYELPVGVAVVRGGNELTLLEANDEFYEITGYSREEATKTHESFRDYIYPKDWGIIEDAVAVGRTKNKAKEFEIRILAKDNKIRWGLFQCQLYYYKDAVPYYIMTSWDITSRKELEDKLQVLGEQYKLLEEIADELPLDYDVGRRQFRVPIKYQGNSPEERREFADFEMVVREINEGDREVFRRVFEEASRVEMSGTLEFRLRRRVDFEKYSDVWYRMVYRSIMGRNHQINRIIGKTYDISRDREKQQKLFEEMRLDPLTRLYNKVASGKEVDYFLEKKPAGTHVLFIIDIDNFKKVNDTFGHTVGDTVISDIAGRIREQFRSTDIVGRVGGDEFMVFMKNTTLEVARAKAEQLCKNVQKHLCGEGEEIIVTLSAGISIYGVNGEDYVSLFEKADDAMYRIKNSGKNAYSFAGDNEIQTQTASERKNIAETDFSGRGNADMEFMNLAFSLLSHAKDLNVSLNVLLEQIGKRFKHSMAAVLEYDNSGGEMLLTNIWSEIGRIYEKSALPGICRAFEGAGVGQFIMIPDGEAEEELFVLENWEKECLKIKTLAGVNFEFSGGRIGVLVIGSVYNDVVWGKGGMETLCELSRLIGVFVTLRDKLRADRHTIHELRHKDRLTGLYDRDTFKDKFEKEMENRQPEAVYALVLMDVNNFSYANENFGTAVGDKILCEVASLLRVDKKYSLFSSHMYSDYFVTLVRAGTREEIKEAVQEKSKMFERELKEKYPAGGISLSAGICFVEEDESFENILEGANLARKYAKEQKIDTGVVYEKDMRQKRDDLIHVTSQFYGAVQKREFEVFLQPKFLLGERKIYGAEALARWRLEDGTILSPDRFIPPLESMGYIVDLDFYIFEQLVRIMKRWKDAGKQMITISTNFSRRNFDNGGGEFLKRIKDVMERYQVPAEYIEIEITESVVLDNIEALKSCMMQLKEMGFRIAIDDFGTGYSSLNVLLEIPANVIKMDKTFTDKLNQKKQRQFVSKMGLLIKAAKEEVIFEGIETEEQLGFLKSCGFKYGQGYLFDRPIPVEEFERKYLS